MVVVERKIGNLDMIGVQISPSLLSLYPAVDERLVNLLAWNTKSNESNATSDIVIV